MKRFGALILTLSLVSVFVLVGCGKTPGGTNTGPAVASNEVQMGPDNFVQTAVTISKGQSVHFVDLPTGAEHIICVGTDGQCKSSSTDPAAVQSPGFTIQPSNSKDVTFDTAGKYQITCTIHPQMNMTVTVQ